uniref:Uncharacterized protein n=1 Tax=Aegilops tauschii subsp. strangulata TaxID=200361 RepID=A0A453AB02_AEGTS
MGRSVGSQRPGRIRFPSLMELQLQINYLTAHHALLSRGNVRWQRRGVC